MEFPTPLIPGRLLRRYKRFLADIELESGDVVTAHCPNPGAMLGLKDPGLRVWVEKNEDPRKKLKYGWRLAELENGHWVGIDTGVPNKVVGAALRAREIAEFQDYPNVRAEVAYGEKSRVDFLLSCAGKPDLYLEIKNVHLCRSQSLAEFPDSVTARGARHLDDLAEMVAQGQRAAMFYFVQRTDCDRFSLADDIDPKYAAAFDCAVAAGVEIFAYATRISPSGVVLDRPIEVATGET